MDWKTAERVDAQIHATFERLGDERRSGKRDGSTSEHQLLREAIADSLGSAVPECAECENLRTQLAELREAAGTVSKWFRQSLEHGAFAGSEHLLDGCPNELKADVEALRTVLARTEEGK